MNSKTEASRAASGGRCFREARKAAPAVHKHRQDDEGGTAGVLGPARDPARADQNINQVIRSPPLDPVGTGRVIERFEEKTRT